LRACLPTAQRLPVQTERKIGTSRFQGSYSNVTHFTARGEPHLGVRTTITNVLEDGKVVGRIFHLEGAAPEGRPWMWASGHNGHICRAAYGYEATREAAMAAFAKSWRRQ
jgi:hypothetical protein